MSRWKRDTRHVPCAGCCGTPIQRPGPRATAGTDFAADIDVWCDDCCDIDDDGRRERRRDVAEHARRNP